VGETAKTPDGKPGAAGQDVAETVRSPLHAFGDGDPFSQSLGRRSHWLRVERGWSRSQVAARLRIPVEHVADHERGTRQMEARDLVAYARLFRIRVGDFFREPATKGTA
jgi:hypothetical protein